MLSLEYVFDPFFKTHFNLYFMSSLWYCLLVQGVEVQEVAAAEPKSETETTKSESSLKHKRENLLGSTLKRSVFCSVESC